MNWSSDQDYSAPAGMTTLRVGDVLELEGELFVVDYMNDCRARCRPVLGQTVKLKTVLGETAEFESHRASVNIAVHAEPGFVLERLGADGLAELLATQQSARRRGAVGGVEETRTSERNERILTMASKLRTLKGEKKITKPRGGLAADMASDAAAGAAPAKRTRKPKAEASPESGEPHSKGKLGEIMGFSVVSVIRTLAKAGASSARVRGIMEARGVPVKPATVQIQVSSGRSGKFGGKPVTYADLTEAQKEELLGLASEPAKEDKK